MGTVSAEFLGMMRWGGKPHKIDSCRSAADEITVGAWASLPGRKARAICWHPTPFNPIHWEIKTTSFSGASPSFCSLQDRTCSFLWSEPFSANHLTSLFTYSRICPSWAISEGRDEFPSMAQNEHQQLSLNQTLNSSDERESWSECPPGSHCGSPHSATLLEKPWMGEC